MSFAEKNKLWLLPVLGVAGAGVLWLNVPAKGPAKAQASRIHTMEEGAPEGAITPKIPGKDDDLKALEAPPAEANETATLLAAGRHAFGENLHNLPRPPALHPDQWEGLAETPRPRPMPRAAGVPVRRQDPPSPDFVIERASGLEAWSQGKAYRQVAPRKGTFVLQVLPEPGPQPAPQTTQTLAVKPTERP